MYDEMEAERGQKPAKVQVAAGSKCKQKYRLGNLQSAFSGGCCFWPLLLAKFDDHSGLLFYQLLFPLAYNTGYVFLEVWLEGCTSSSWMKFVIGSGLGKDVMRK